MNTAASADIATQNQALLSPANAGRMFIPMLEKFRRHSRLLIGEITMLRLASLNINKAASQIIATKQKIMLFSARAVNTDAPKVTERI